MNVLDPVLVASLPETATLDILASTIETTIITLLAAHPCLERDEHPAPRCFPTPPPCCLANAIIEHLYELDNAIIRYRDLVEAELHAERTRCLPF